MSAASPSRSPSSERSSPHSASRFTQRKGLQRIDTPALIVEEARSSRAMRDGDRKGNVTNTAAKLEGGLRPRPRPQGTHPSSAPHRDHSSGIVNASSGPELVLVCRSHDAAAFFFRRRFVKFSSQTSPI